MRKVVVLLMLMIAAASASAQEAASERISPLALINMKYKDAYVKIVYSRPNKNGRQIFGALVPYDQIWRTGANEATEITLTKDMTVNNILLRAGTYSMFTIPQRDKWTIIINAELGLWGAYNYNNKLDVFRFDVPVQAVSSPVQEAFTMTFIQKNEMADLLIQWDTVRISIPLKFLN